MKRKFKNYIEEHSLVPPQTKHLLAVSGGVDSMVMLYLFHECGFNFNVAHCNFNLRGSESDADEQFVRETCRRLGVEIHVKPFSTADYASEKNVSIQVAARDLRYTWFSSLCVEIGFNSVAVAHNKNDIAETVLLNLTRGTGLKGLTGIKPKTNGIIRPLLFAFRNEIEAYAKGKNIAYRNDSSNAKTKYARNRIRHKVLPELEKINQGVIDNIYSSSIYLGATWQAIENMNQSFRAKVKSEVDDEIHYSLNRLFEYPFRQVFLIEELTELGFSPTTVLDIEKSLLTQSGKIFYSQRFQLIRDREALIVSPIKENIETFEIKISESTFQINYPVELRLQVITPNKNFEIPKSTEIAVLDYSKLTFPLIVRHWQEGDWFIPFGMKGRKKISDFLIDQKVPLHRKDQIYVLESNGDIVWVVGFRIDNRYRVLEQSTKVLMVRVGCT